MIENWSIEWVVGKGAIVHLVTVGDESIAFKVQSWPQTLIVFFDGSLCREVSRPVWVIDTWQPPAKEQLTGESRAAAEIGLANLAEVESVAKSCTGDESLWKYRYPGAATDVSGIPLLK